MGLAPRLELRQRTSLVMTPQLQQAIKLLQFNNVELTDYVEAELERNPLLERGDTAGEPDLPANAPNETAPEPPAAEPQGEPQGEPVEAAPADAVDLTGGDTIPSDSSAPLDADYSNVYSDDAPESYHNAADTGLQEGSWAGLSGGGGSFDGEDRAFDANLSEDETLKDHLLEQVNLTFNDPVERAIALQLVDGMDLAGYLIMNLENLAERLSIDLAVIESVLARLQDVAPAGVGARDLAECLKLQLLDKNRFDPLIEILVNNLDLLAKHDLKGIMKKCGVDEEDARDMIADIRDCDPKPGMKFDTATAAPVIADVIVRDAPDGGWAIDVNSDALPKVLVNNAYKSRLGKSMSKEDKAFVTDAMANANWLVKALDQRANTILKVATEITRLQDGFFRHGVQHLKPLTLRDIAEEIEMHESTVSRVTNGKFMQTPRGLLEFKYFFTSSIKAADGGDALSAESVKQKIKTLIDAEDPKKILSDDKLVEMLAADGVDIARRTVAKYREAMDIPSSVQRRRIKKSLIM